MCDETTEIENEACLDGLRLMRRELTIGASAALAMLLTGCKDPSGVTPAVESSAGHASKPASVPPVASTTAGTAAPTSTAFQAALAGFPATTARMVDVETPDGRADGFFVTPKKGKHPGVVMWPDIAGLREAFMTMAARLASEGYAVLAVNQYYRSARFPILGNFAEWRTDEGRAKITSMKAAIPFDGIARDGAAFVSWLDRQPEVDTEKKIACAGYCMTGSYTFRAAAAVPERVGVIASFHGTDLVTNESTSPHLLLFKTKKLCALVCIAQNDDEREPATKKTLRRAAESARAAAEIEVYPAQHGFCPLDSPVYDGPQAEKAWSRMLYRFERYL